MRKLLPMAPRASHQFYHCIQIKLGYNTVNNNICPEITMRMAMSSHLHLMSFTLQFDLIYIYHIFIAFSQITIWLINGLLTDRMNEWISIFLYFWLMSFTQTNAIHPRFVREFTSVWCGVRVLSKSVYVDSLLI